ncbi:CYTH domain-containing protein [Bacillus sp. CBEL-1]|uniref:CYTH domain-containing protein n=1 Tax=Bacillus sp. CBEL-1 TaxID=2502980 RepID=UPI0010483A1C|nr:CYTH domain-containing protein [Bacillus sp. CBEL-1]TDB53198.1 CYTH domain-containing protein [Bacillus sp. CBEL-1]
MKQEIEIEFKNLVNKSEFKKLLAYFQLTDRDFIMQENHYFDTNDFQLKSAGAALRIRNKNGKFVLTLKQPHKNGLLETHVEITEPQAQELMTEKENFPTEMAVALQQLGVSSADLTYFGTLQTYRAEIEYKSGLLVFDHSFYLDTDDVEIEYEVQDEKQGLLAFENLLQDFEIPKRNTANKIKRFYDRKYQLLSEE